MAGYIRRGRIKVHVLEFVPKYHLNVSYFVSFSALGEGSIEFVLKMKNIRNAFRVYLEN